MEDPNNILKKGLEKPSEDFTQNLMLQIEAEEKVLNRVLKEHGELTTTPDFSTNLMGKLEGMTPRRPYEPVISKRIWGAIAAFIAVLIAVVFSTSTSESSGLSINLSKIDFNFVMKLESNPILVYTICGILLFSIALLTEQRLSAKKRG